MTVTTQYRPSGTRAREISASVEAAIASGALAPGTPLPTVRALAAELGVSPTTAAAAYRLLRGRGLAVGAGRRGTHVAVRPPLSPRAATLLPPGGRDLATGSPDPALLPDLARSLARLPARAGRYASEPCIESLLAPARDRLAADHIPADSITVVSGALDGVERTLAAHLSPGDAVAVEDPGYAAVLDLLPAMALTPVPVAIDDEGMVPVALDAALRRGVRAVVLTPRAQNPTGAALTASRARQLAAVVRRRDLLVVEDDHAGAVSGAAAFTLAGTTGAWAVVRSVSKSLGPDLRLAVLAGDETTIARVEGRLRLGAGWVSQLLQQVVADLWAHRSTERLLARAAETYRRRREALLTALAGREIPAVGVSGLNVWVPVREEQPVVAGLLTRGWAVTAGERFRLRSGPAIRITVATLEPADAAALARDVERVARPSRATRSG